MGDMRERFVKLLAKIKDWVLEHKKLSLLIGLVLAAAIGTGVYFWLRAGDAVNRTDSSSDSEIPEPPKLVPSPLTGVEVTQDLARRPVIGVMIENSTDARPQSGLADAGVVFEAIAEGGITRFIVFYQEDMPKNIGPVRSLRPYYLDWALMFDAAVAHVGGSPEALARARTELGKRDLDQFRYGTKAFDRVSFRRAPHNVYTDIDRLMAIATEAGHTSSDFTSLERKPKSPSPTPNATSITVNFSSAGYRVGWAYDAAGNVYSRSNGGVAQTDRDTGKPINADVVVVLKSVYRITDSVGHRAITSTGTGEAIIFQDGLVTTGSWNRSPGGQYTFKDTAGASLKLNPGRTWFEVIPTSESVTYQ